jgi:magnesium transporter
VGDDEPVIVDCAVYTDGKRRDGHLPLEQALEAATEPDSFVWIGLHEPSHDEFEAVREEFGLHELAVEDAIAAHQRPKLEVYDDDLFVVLKTARYDDVAETVAFAELQLFVGASYVVTVRHGQASALAEVRRNIENDLARIRCGPMAVLHAVMDRVVDDYVPVIDGLDNDMAEIEDAVCRAAPTIPANGSSSSSARCSTSTATPSRSSSPSDGWPRARFRARTRSWPATSATWRTTSSER